MPPDFGAPSGAPQGSLFTHFGERSSRKRLNDRESAENLHMAAYRKRVARSQFFGLLVD